MARGHYNISVVRDTAELAALKPQWDELFISSPSASPPLRWEWISEWWRVFGTAYGDGGRGLRVLTVRRESHLVGVLPLYEQCVGHPLFSPRILRFISSGVAEFEETCAEYTNLLFAPEHLEPCIESLGEFILRSREVSWDELHLTEMPDDTPLLGLSKTLSGSGRIVKALSPGVCHISDLRGGWEGYLQHLSSGTRYKARKIVRDSEKAGMAFDIAQTSDDAERFFDQLVELHRARWTSEGKPGSFAPRHAQFHRALAIALVPKQEVILARLSFEGAPLALLYGHRVGKKFDCYQCGTSLETSAVRSPGTAVSLRLMKYLSEQGVTTYDHLAGSNEFKQNYAKHSRPLVNLTAYRPSLKSAAHVAGYFVQRAGRKAVKSLLGIFAGADSSSVIKSPIHRQNLAPGPEISRQPAAPETPKTHTTVGADQRRNWAEDE